MGENANYRNNYRCVIINSNFDNMVQRLGGDVDDE